MNVTNFEAPKLNSATMMQDMVARQAQLEEAYHSIEARNGFAMPAFDLDHPMCQDKIKHLSWCIVEELAEMNEALIRYRADPSRYPYLHWMEEFADALHFLLAIYVFTEPRRGPTGFINGLADITNNRDVVFRETITSLGIMCNTLKNKRWKEDRKETYADYFYRMLDLTTHNMGRLWAILVKNEFYNSVPGPHDSLEKMIFDLYFRKSEVNKFRQRSGY